MYLFFNNCRDVKEKSSKQTKNRVKPKKWVRNSRKTSIKVDWICWVQFETNWPKVIWGFVGVFGMLLILLLER